MYSSETPSSSTRGPMKKRTRCRSLVVWWCLFPLLVFAVTLSSFARFDVLYDEDNDNGGFQWSGAKESLASCTYEQLDKAFGNSGSVASAESSLPFVDHQNDDDDDDNNKCWRVSERILRVPRSAILNFHSLIPLGHGSKSGVYMVFLSLSYSQPPCKAVYKTDMANTNICASVWTHPFSSRWSLFKSCLSAHFLPFQSSMPGELTGGVIFQTLRQYAADHPDDPLDASGILPTWGMVPLYDEEDDDNEHHDHHHHHHHPVMLRHHHDHHHHHHNRRDFPPVMGVIMPFQKLHPLQNDVAASRTAAQVAALMQTAAQGMAYVHQLGLAHQDVLVRGFKNVGLVEAPDGTPSHSIIFDWGYTAYDDTAPQDTTCTWGRACDFCIESFFPKPRVGGSHGAKHSRRRTLDCANLRDMVINLLDHVTDADTEGRHWQEQLQNQVDCSRSTQELADVLAVAAQGHA